MAEKVYKENQKSKIKNLNQKLKIENTQHLYGVIQGGVFEDLRKKSAEFVVSQNTEGVAIGGVSVGESKSEMRDQVRWVADYLPKDRPVHLLGVGQFDDIFDLVSYGIDTFDCVEPTRLARMGTILKLKVKNQKLKIEWEKIDILKGAYRGDFSPIDESCNCYVCQNFTKSYLHHLFKNRELLGYTLATYHNLWAMEKFFSWIREAIANDLI
ncbi:MAG: tRNA-guanine transglycosylase [Microgenomates group bacterium]